MHFVASLENLWQVCCGGWLWDIGILGVGGVGVVSSILGKWCVLWHFSYRGGFSRVVVLGCCGGEGALVVLVFLRCCCLGGRC
jgi:hypothetical protein